METKNNTWSIEEYRLHVAAAKLLDEIKDEAFERVSKAISGNERVSEYDLQQFILKRYREEGLVSSIPPVVAVGEGSREPHHKPRGDVIIGPESLVLVDVFAKVDEPCGVYADITWMGYTGEKVPARYEEVFDIVVGARDAVLDCLESSFREGVTVRGYMLDDVARGYITGKGFGDYFIHRTGHSLGRELVGRGVHPDNYKTKDIREVVPGCGFTIEPGIYLKDYGMRSEVDVYITEKGPEVTTRIQKVITELIE